MHLRLLPYAIADGFTNMADDEALVHSAANGIASLRFYGWNSATVSLGYFQACAARHVDPLLSPLPWVRRPSGGATLVHHHEVTYALAVPQGLPWQDGSSWLLRMHQIIVNALERLGLAGKIALVNERPIKHGGLLCFQQFAVGDVLCMGHKIVGSAQRKYRQALMQHGSILLAQSEHVPSLPGIRELTGIDLQLSDVLAVTTKAFAEQTGWTVEPGDWTFEEQKLVAELCAARYATVAWNERR